MVFVLHHLLSPLFQIQSFSLFNLKGAESPDKKLNDVYKDNILILFYIFFSESGRYRQLTGANKLHQ